MHAIHPALFLAAAAIAAPTGAALPVGSKAPDFKTTGALAGKPFTLHLADQLKHGPLTSRMRGICDRSTGRPQE